MIDGTDLQILTILQDGARTSNADVARSVGLTPPAVLERIRKLERRGLITGYHARLEAEHVGLGLLAFVYVRTGESLGEQHVSYELAEIPEVQEVHHVAGEDCYLVKVRAKGPQALGRLLRERFGQIPSVISTRSTIVLETVKEDSRLALPVELSEEENRGDDEAR